jgi:hypothetical protein
LAGLGAGCRGGEPAWQVRFRDEQSWLLALTGLSDRLIAVGGQPGSGAGSPGVGVVLSLPDDPAVPPQTWPSPQPGMLWWAHAVDSTIAGGRIVWLCGEGGSVVRYQEQGQGPPQLQAVGSATTATLYGIWAFADSDVWAVGGSDGGPGVVLHGDRSGLTVDSSVPKVPGLFKLFASDPDHLFVVGSSGTLLRRDRGGWHLDPPLFSDRLLTVFGTSATKVWAVGGLGAAQLLGWDGQHWQLDGAVDGLAPLSGLYATEQELLLVGQRGLIARRQSSSLPSSLPLTIDPALTALDLHAALLRGGVRYAVGGNLSLYGLKPPQGVLLAQGAP